MMDVAMEEDCGNYVHPDLNPDTLYPHPDTSVENMIFRDANDYWDHLGAKISWSAMYTFSGRENETRRPILSPPFHQGQMNICGVASTVQSIEAMLRIYRDYCFTGSKQELIDCVPVVYEPQFRGIAMREITKEYGASASLLLRYTNLYGLVREEQYPFAKKRHDHPKQSFNMLKVKIDIPKPLNTLAEISDRLKHQPLIANMTAYPSFEKVNSNEIYMGMTEEDKEQTRGMDLSSRKHSVQLIGDGPKVGRADVPYYVIQNTWGSDWGVDGGARASVKCFTDVTYPQFIDPFITYLPRFKAHSSLRDFYSPKVSSCRETNFDASGDMDIDEMFLV